MTVSLAEFATRELRQEAIEVGRERYNAAKRLNRTQPFGDPGENNRLYIDCYSALAEGLVASWLGVHWVKELRDDLSSKPPDVGTRTEVRWTRHATGHLISHDSDVDGRLIVLVRKELPDIEAVGWTTVQSTKNRIYQNNPKARCELDYWVPARDLFLCELLFQMRRSA